MQMLTIFRRVKRLVNIALVILILASITLLAEHIANQITVQANNKDKSAVFVERSNSNQALLYSKGQPVQEQVQPFVGAVNGKAFILKEVIQGVETTQLKTALPVFKAFGLSKDERKILYTSLKNGNPSGELYLEDFSTRKLTKVTSRLVLAAALSPVDDNQIAYTFAGSETFGLAIAELDSGQDRIHISENVFAEVLQWDDYGRGVYYFETINQEERLKLHIQYTQVEPMVLEKALIQNIPSGFPMLKQFAIPDINSQTLVNNKTTLSQNDYSFRAVAPDGIHEVVGNNMLGISQLSVRNMLSGASIMLGEGQFVKALRTGVVIKEFLSTGVKWQFVDWEGKNTKISEMVTNYKLPVQNSSMIQGGAGYNSPGNCNLTAHFGIHQYAYDFQSQTISAHIMAAADGLVVFTTSSVVCNTIDPNCPDYNANGCPGTYLGNVVIIQHADGTYTSYAHMETNSVQTAVGTSVCQGLYVGRQGHTGSTTGNLNDCGDHLHFQRQSSPDIGGQSIAIDFSDVTANPLSCSTEYSSGNTEVSHSISPNSQNFGINGGNGSINVTSTGCTWSVISNENWITITSSGNGSGNDVVTYSVADNSANESRIGTMNVAGHIFTVSQNGGVTNQAPLVNAGSDQTITLPALANLSGMATDDGLPNPPNTLTTTWSKVSGPGIVTFGDANALNTTAGFSQSGVYVLQLTADDSVLTGTDDVIVTVNNSSAAGLLFVSQTSTPVNVNLTTEGMLDWAHWGLTTPTSFNHKSGVTQQITNYTSVGSGVIERYTNNPNFYSWNDGTPNVTTNNTSTGVYVIGLNNGFQLTFPADTTQRTLKLYIGLWSAKGKLEATLSDGSISPYIDTSLVNSSGTSNAVYTLNYQAGNNGQTLTVRWTVNEVFNQFSNVTLQAASLSNPFEADVAPRPWGSNSGTVTTADVIQIRRFFAGLDQPYQHNEFQRADCAPLNSFGNGAMSIADVVQARRFLAGLDMLPIAAGPMSTNLFGNGVTLLSGTSLYSSLIAATAVPNELSVTRVSFTGNKVVIAVEFESQGNAVGVGFSLNYDVAVLSNPANITLGNGANGATLTVNSTQVNQGRLGVGLDKDPTQPFPAGGIRQLVTIEFDVAANAPASTTIGFSNLPIVKEVVLSDNTILSPTANSSQIALFVPTAGYAPVGGQVMTAAGLGISKAIVTITNATGETRTALTNNFGYYRFEQVIVGESYIFTVSSKRYNFNSPSQIQSIGGERNDINFVAND